MSERIYGYCPSCYNEVFNCDPNYLINIRHVTCGKCNTFSHKHQLSIETKETNEFDAYLSPYEALSELRKGSELEFYDEDGFWFQLSKDNPIRILWEYKIRIK